VPGSPGVSLGPAPLAHGAVDGGDVPAEVGAVHCVHGQANNMCHRAQQPCGQGQAAAVA
jgi:hypothetical protein